MATVSGTTYMNVSLSGQFGKKCCINCTENISELSSVGSGQSSFQTGTGNTIEDKCLYTKRYTVDICITARSSTKWGLEWVVLNFGMKKKKIRNG